MKNSLTRLTILKITIFLACIGCIWVLFIIIFLLASLVLEHQSPMEAHNIIYIVSIATLLYLLIISKQQDKIIDSKEPLARMVRALKAYSECHQALIRAKDELQLMNAVCRIFIEVGGYRMAWVGIAENNAQQDITPVAGWGDDLDFIEIFKNRCMNKDIKHSAIKTAIRTGKAVVLQHAKREPGCEICWNRILNHGFCSSIFLPLKNKGKTFAALMIYSSGEDLFDDEEVALLTDLVDDLAYGIIALRVAEENLKVEQQRLQLASVIMQMQAGLLLLDNQAVIQFANPVAERIIGIPLTELVNHDLYKPPGNKEKALFDTILQKISSGHTYPEHFRFQQSDNVYLELELSTWNIKDNDNAISSHVVMIRDFTTKMQLENQLRRAQRMEAIGILAGGIAHDFNNALASIITCTELALDEVDSDSAQKELLEIILKSGLRGKELVRQILTFSRQTEQQPQDVDVELIVKECLKLLRTTLSPSIEIRLRIGKGPKNVLADPTQIHQVVMNLCTNAVHAIQNRSHGVIELILENEEITQNKVFNFALLKPGNYLCLSVQDNGHGMDADTIEKIFNPFFSTKSQSEGTGLGLSVIHGIISHLGGDIAVQSTPGKGSLFSVYLPVEANIHQPAATETMDLATQVGNERILLVDDDQQLLISTDLLLQQLGYQVTTCGNPEFALQLFREKQDQFDLVITDQAMPQMSGTELAAQINCIRSDIPIVLCTGYDPFAGYGNDENGQILDYITELAIKPLERSELAATVRHALAAS